MAQYIPQIPKNNFAAVTSPLGTDDNTKGYSIGSMWFNTATGYLYTCSSAAGGAAVWNDLSPGVGNTYHSPVIPTGAIDGSNVYYTLPYSPIYGALTLSGQTLIIGVHYTISGTTITMLVPLDPAFAIAGFYYEGFT